MTLTQTRIARLALAAGVGVFALGAAFVAGLFAAAETMSSILDYNTGPDDDDDDPAAMGRREFPDVAA